MDKGEGQCQVRLMDLPVFIEHLKDAERHRRIVRPRPLRFLGRAPGVNLLGSLAWLTAESAFTESVAQGEAVKASAGCGAARLTFAVGGVADCQRNPLFRYRQTLGPRSTTACPCHGALW